MPAQKPGTSKQNYATPMNFITAVQELLGIDQFDFDYAAERHTAKAEFYWTKEDNSLSPQHDWRSQLTDDGWGWLNPPFAKIGPWAKRCHELAQAGGRVAFLVPAGVGANWYRDYVHSKARVLALNGRLAFIKGKPKLLYPKDCILALYGPDFTPGFDVWSWKP
jgi:phage N-6-adenine-methyltransferase